MEILYTGANWRILLNDGDRNVETVRVKSHRFLLITRGECTYDVICIKNILSLKFI